MWVLFGANEYYSETKERIASFSSEKLAKEYIEKSKLKNITLYRMFKRNSMLSNCVDAWVEWEDDLVYDPDPPK